MFLNRVPCSHITLQIDWRRDAAKTGRRVTIAAEQIAGILKQ
jgi:hypothetical protein